MNHSDGYRGILVVVCQCVEYLSNLGKPRFPLAPSFCATHKKTYGFPNTFPFVTQSFI